MRGPMHLRACVSEERGDGEGAGSQALSDTLRYINFAGLAIGLVALRRALSKQSTLSRALSKQGALSRALSNLLWVLLLSLVLSQENSSFDDDDDDVLVICDVFVICEACDIFGRRRSGRYVCAVIRSVWAGGGVFLAFLPARPCGS